MLVFLTCSARKTSKEGKVVGKRKKKGKRGYPKLALVSLNPMKAYLWRIYSVRAKPLSVIKLGRKWTNATESQLYRYFNDILNKLKPMFSRGVRSLVVVSPDYPEFPEMFLKHLADHHQWLYQREQGHPLQVLSLEGSTTDLDAVYSLFSGEEMQEKVFELLEREADEIIALLDECLSKDNGVVMVTIKEIEKLILPKKKHRRTWADYLIVNEEYLEEATPRQKNRLNRVFAIARNKGVKQRVLPPECPASDRLASLGGIACFLTYDPRFEML